MELVRTENIISPAALPMKLHNFFPYSHWSGVNLFLQKFSICVSIRNKLYGTLFWCSINIILS